MQVSEEVSEDEYDDNDDEVHDEDYIVEPPHEVRDFRVTKLWKIRQKYSAPQWKLASECGIAPTSFSEYICGSRVIPTKHIIAMCLFFNVSAQDIIGWCDDIETPSELEDTFRGM